jgi:hypothetical protein
MLSYAGIKDKPQILQRITGLQPEEFTSLLESFATAWQAYLKREYIDRPRSRRFGGGRHAHLHTIEDKLLFILTYFWLYPTQAVQGSLFGLGQPQTNEWIHKLSGVLNQALGHERQLPGREPWRLAELLRQCPSLETLIKAPAQGASL